MKSLRNKLRGQTQNTLHNITHEQLSVQIHWKIEPNVWFTVGQEIRAITRAAKQKL